MHPELNLHIAQLRHQELIGAVHRPAPAHRGWRGFFRRRRETRAAVGLDLPPIVLLPPPREERDPTGRDQRVA